VSFVKSTVIQDLCLPQTLKPTLSRPRSPLIMIRATATQIREMETAKDLLTVVRISPTEAKLEKYPWCVRILHPRSQLTTLRPTKGIKPVVATNLQTTMRDLKLLPPNCYHSISARIKQSRNGNVPDLEKWRERCQKQKMVDNQNIPMKKGVLVELVCGYDGTGFSEPACDYHRECTILCKIYN
jgi:hypothetical protein